MERPSRTGLISLLVAVEVVIAGIALYTLRDGAFSATGVHEVEYAAAPIAPIAAGPSPVVTVDDIDSKVVVTTSNDGLVRVTDETRVHGFMFGENHAQKLEVSRTLDGVRIYRPAGHFVFGNTTTRIEVAVPPMTRLTIARSGGAEITGLQNGVDVLSQDGRITLTDVTGDIKAHSDDGRIVASGVHSNALDLTTNDGRLQLSNIELTGASPHATMHTNDGPVFVSGVFPASGNYSLSTSDGRVALTLMRGSDVNLDASTGDGRVIVDGREQSGTIQVGTGSAPMRVRTEDGSIHIITNGAQ